MPEIEFISARKLLKDLQAMDGISNQGGILDGDALMRALEREAAVTQELPKVGKPSWDIMSHDVLCYVLYKLREAGREGVGLEDEDLIEDLLVNLHRVDEADIDNILMALEKIKQVLSAVASDCMMGRILASKKAE